MVLLPLLLSAPSQRVSDSMLASVHAYLDSPVSRKHKSRGIEAAGGAGDTGRLANSGPVAHGGGILDG